MQVTSLQAEHLTPLVTADISAWMGYPSYLHVAGIQSAAPLAWWTADEAGRALERGSFLQPTGLPLGSVISKEELAAIPTEWQVLLDSVPYMQWQLLQAMLSSSEAAELALSNPMLFIMLVDWAESKGVDKHAFYSLVTQKRTNILRRIGLPPSKSVVKILSRCKAELRDSSELDFIRKELTLPESINLLSHVPKLGLVTFRLLVRHRPEAWPGLLKMIDPDTKVESISSLARLLSDTRNMGATDSQLRKLQTIRQLHELHDKLVLSFNQSSVTRKSQALERSYGAYPEAPIPGTEDIIPLTSWSELLREGIQMNHCVGSYARDVHLGNSFVYRVIYPERLTLAIEKRQNGWQLSEIRGHSNSSADKRSIMCATLWLLQNR